MLTITVLHRNGAGLPSRAEADAHTLGPVLSSGRKNSLPIGMIVDGAFDEDWLTSVEEIRCSLPLDSKRPTVDRRFFADDSEGRTIVSIIETKVKEAILHAQALFVLDKQDQDSELFVYCNKYLRILEYTNPGSGLAPHTDGTKVCEQSGATSTHTFLLFLSECSKGGETVLLDGKHGWTSHSKVVVPPERVVSYADHADHAEPQLLRDMTDSDTSTNVSLGVSPHVGRILFFPHEWPHAGAICETVPKVILRAELTIEWMKKTETC